MLSGTIKRAVKWKDANRADAPDVILIDSLGYIFKHEYPGPDYSNRSASMNKFLLLVDKANNAGVSVLFIDHDTVQFRHGSSAGRRVAYVVQSIQYECYFITVQQNFSKGEQQGIK
jgi:hypothetical protein